MLTNYNFNIQYQPRKANKVADALSRKTYDTLMRRLHKELAKEIRDLELMIVHGKVANLKVWPVILDDIEGR